MVEETIAHYRITDKIGQGGMGEVYRATDTKLNRDVAVKVLPESFAKDRDRMARFSREAQVLASLNHPNIAAIHGLEESSGKLALVMELVEGETLQERIQRGAIPLEEAMTLAKQIAEALEEAHEHGFIHRDLKPANVKITPNGTVKVLDFGLAKALEGESGSGSSPDLSQSPTLSAAATAAGVILGTAAYMSPEQARGQAVDRRGDIWSFGVVLYEMLTGRQTFTGDTVSDVLAAVLRSDIDLNALPGDVPPAIRQLLRRCLTRERKRRVQSIGDVRIAIEEYLENPAAPVEASVAAVAPAVRPLWQRALPWGLVAIAGTVAAALALAALLAPDEPSMWLSVELGDRPFAATPGSPIALSPDGNSLVYLVEDSSSQDLRIRPLNQLEGTTLASGGGTSGPYNPFFSPDSKWVGFVTTTELLKVPVTGGTPLRLCGVDRSRGATWGPDDTIVFTPSTNSGLFSVPATGGEPQPLTTLDEANGETTHRWPQFLPGGEAVLFTSNTGGGYDNGTIEVLVMDTGERKVIHRGGTQARYVPAGYLVYVNQATLFAAPFDLGSLEMTGSPAPIIQEVDWNVGNGGAAFSFSDTGDLAYVRGDSSVPEYPVVWVDRDGGTMPLLEERGSYANPRLSPDGTRLALTVLRDGNWDVWVYDLERGVSTRLTFEESVDTEQNWSPDGEYLIFSSDRNRSDDLYRKRSDGSGDLELVVESESPLWASSWSSDGRFVSYMTATGALDLWVVPMDGDGTPELFLSTPFAESDADFSPDGRWLAYASDESGRSEIYVRPFPPGGGKWQVSDSGGGYPRWSGDGRELFYRTDEGVMVASVEGNGDTFRAGKPRPVVEGSFRGGVGGLPLAGNVFADWEVTPDGQRFIMFPSVDESGQVEHPHVTIVTHWFDELRRTFGGGAN